jgi:rod shape-determining protein MreD
MNVIAQIIYIKRFIFFSLVFVAFLLLLPFATTWLCYLPDLPSMTLLYWLLHQKDRVSFGVAFAFGLLLDILMHSPFGLHALSCIVMAYGVLLLRPTYILMHGFMFQSAFVGLLLFANNLVVLLMQFFLNDAWMGSIYFLSPLLSAVTWPLFNKFILVFYYKFFGSNR